MNLGNLKLNKSFFLAPMEEVTSASFRLIARKLGADIVFTEFTSCEALIRNIPKAIEKIKFRKEEHPIGIQLFGFSIDSMSKAAKIAEKFHPDFIDINAGCWARRHVSRGECAALLRNLPHFELLLKNVVKATKLPITVKTRLGWDSDNIVILDVAKMVEQCGAKALTVHCRTRNQGYKGQADWKWLEKIRKIVNIPLIGNGDVVTPQDAKYLFDLGCDGVMIGRQAIANPWIFKETKHFIKSKEILPPPPIKEKIDICIKHLKLFMKYKNEKQGIYPFRKFFSGYLKGIKNSTALKIELLNMTSAEEIILRLKNFVKEQKDII